MHARFSGLRNIITALGYGHMNASFTYAICSEEHVHAALMHFAKNAANLRIAQNYQSIFWRSAVWRSCPYPVGGLNENVCGLSSRESCAPRLARKYRGPAGLLNGAGGPGRAARAELAFFELEGEHVDETCGTFATRFEQGLLFDRRYV